MSAEIIAILRGVQPTEVLAIGEVLIDVGITKIEVPLNSPNPIKSIETLVHAYSVVAEIGAGTVLTLDQVKQVADAGGQLIVSPNMQPEVIAVTKQHGMRSYPGIQTVTEALAALHNGADALKLFPAHLIGPVGLQAFSAVLPSGVKSYAVGGVGPENFSDWVAAGVSGFGMGSYLYKPGCSAKQVKEKALVCVQALQECY